MTIRIGLEQSSLQPHYHETPQVFTRLGFVYRILAAIVFCGLAVMFVGIYVHRDQEYPGALVAAFGSTILGLICARAAVDSTQEGESSEENIPLIQNEIPFYGIQ